jgi:hypothetical protein
MKTVMLPFLLLLTATAFAQPAEPQPVVRTSEGVIIHARYPALYSSNGNTLTLQHLRENGFDRLAIFDARGNTVMRADPVTNGSRVDISHLDDGVYLLVFRSSETMKEKVVKFVIRRG